MIQALQICCLYPSPATVQVFDVIRVKKAEAVVLEPSGANEAAKKLN